MSRVQVYLLAACCVALVGWLHLRDHDAQTRKLAAAHALLQRDQAQLNVAKDSLASARFSLDVTLSTLDTVKARFDRARANLKPVVVTKVKTDTFAYFHETTDTLRLEVPAAFIAQADSLRTYCEIMGGDCQRLRARADSTIAAQDRIIQQLKKVEKAKGSGFLSKLKWGVIGMGAGYVVGRVQ